MELKKDMYDVFGNRRPVEDLSEAERQEQIKSCKVQLEHLRKTLESTCSVHRERNNDMIGASFKAGSPEAIKLQIESIERYLLELTKPERAKEIFDVLEGFGKE